jgi:hypothetical protein
LYCRSFQTPSPPEKVILAPVQHPHRVRLIQQQLSGGVGPRADALIGARIFTVINQYNPVFCNDSRGPASVSRLSNLLARAESESSARPTHPAPASSGLNHRRGRRDFVLAQYIQYFPLIFTACNRPTEPRSPPTPLCAMYSGSGRRESFENGPVLCPMDQVLGTGRPDSRRHRCPDGLSRFHIVYKHRMSHPALQPRAGLRSRPSIRTV